MDVRKNTSIVMAEMFKFQRDKWSLAVALAKEDGAINSDTGNVYKFKRCGLINASYHKK